MRVAILGTGLIGSSIGLGLRARVEDVQVVGYDRDSGALDVARRRGAIHEAARDAASAVRDADIVILAVPVLAIQKLLGEIKDHVKRSAVITDTGSSKTEIMRTAREALGSHEGFVAGHPMAGKTDFGPTAADPDLFDGATWVIAPSVTASESSITVVTNLVETLGGKPVVMDAEEHDAYVAAISHLPMMAATALFSLGRASEAWPELSSLAAGGFRDMTRLAGTDPAMSYDIAVTNRENIAHWLDRYIVTLQELRRRLVDAEGEDDLYKLLAATELDYARFRSGKVGRDEETDKGPMDIGGSFQDFVAGAWVREKFTEIMKDSEERLAKMDAEERSRRKV
ncbi:MAG: prephenate dehydrogenase/arogenate dehydrogenase family protein [Dehalococcoidia bacterium]|nr:prephenate dehydrogenase/arogenate dehydrogenase family protein [Dehalococcoidia bacterium]